MRTWQSTILDTDHFCARAHLCDASRLFLTLRKGGLLLLSPDHHFGTADNSVLINNRRHYHEATHSS